MTPAPQDRRNADDPRKIYAQRLELRSKVVALEKRRELALSRARLLVFLAGLITAWPALMVKTIPFPWLLLPLSLFIVLVVVHGRVSNRREYAERAAKFYEDGLARLDERWAGKGVDGVGFAPADHPYASDLDLFGEGSLFELLCQARTGAGRRMLADWLLATSPVAEVRLRQQAVEELRERLDLREDLAILAERVRDEVHPGSLAAWGKGEPVELPAWTRVSAVLVSLLTTAGLVAWGMGYGVAPFLAAAILHILQMWFTARREAEIAQRVDAPGRELEILAGVLGRFEAESFNSERLRELESKVAVGGTSPSAAIRDLSRKVDRLEFMRNQVFAPIGILLCWRLHVTAGIEAWRRRHGAHVAVWLDAAGEWEALSSLACFAYENPSYPVPEIVDDGPLFEAQGLGHPLLPREGCVHNDVRLAEGANMLIVSGSNMSGKSTLLRSVGINTVLALAGANVRADVLRVSFLSPGASIRVGDSLRDGRSRFYAEILRLRQLMDLIADRPPLLFLIDEMLQGTNSHDRRIGAENVLEQMVRRGAIGLITTHDLALTRVAEGLGERAVNKHFEDRLIDGELQFDYRLREGVVERSNALELMRAIGLEVPDSPRT